MKKKMLVREKEDYSDTGEGRGRERRHRSVSPSDRNCMPGF